MKYKIIYEIPDKYFDMIYGIDNIYRASAYWYTDGEEFKKSQKNYIGTAVSNSSFTEAKDRLVGLIREMPKDEIIEI